MRKIGISVITLFPFSWGPWGPAFLGWFYRKTGLLLQLVPLLGWNKSSVIRHIPPEAVISYEGIWDEGETFKQILHRIFGKDPAAILGLLLFGVDSVAQKKVAWFRELYPNAFAVDLGGESDLDLQEISPTRKWSNAPRLVYDTLHRKEALVSDEDASRLVSRVRLVHFQTRNKQEFQELLKGHAPYSLAWDCILIKNMPVPIIIEVPPQFLWPYPIGKALDISTKVRVVLL